MVCLWVLFASIKVINPASEHLKIFFVYRLMYLKLNHQAPNFITQTTAGEIDFHELIGDSYAILFSHPKDFTPVCTTEFGAVARLVPEFQKRNTKVIGVSVDDVDDHQKWIRDIEAFAGSQAEDRKSTRLNSSHVATSYA